MATTIQRSPAWALIAPIVTLLLLAGQLGPFGLDGWYSAMLGASLMLSIIAAVHHAELLAYGIGEPLGTLVLALAITVIEVSLIVSVMLATDGGATMLARDTVFATVMIILNLIIGLSFVIGCYRFGEQRFILPGVSTALTTLSAIVVLALILPNFTTSTSGPHYTDSQLGFVAIVSLVLYGVFIFVQAVRHRDYFLVQPTRQEAKQQPDMPIKTLLTSGIFLILSLVGVVSAAKLLSPMVKGFVAAWGAPEALVGIIIALIVLMPEGFASLRAAANNQLQTSLNLALGSALATIGLTIPTVAVVAITLDMSLVLGLESKSIILLTLTLFIASLSMSTGRVTVMQGTVHIVLFLTYLFMTIVP
ncbi:ionic transporter y4hA [Candidatus Thiothrix sp. Deng01]|uniref:Ionic transporter y4hA n=1 Tax=Candidatus Thiothrix phosphatis TaxID=3112415 RepID=A0ABU6CZU3_9GAMM|nr:ionic transporter y4hA [Candidatus Thiothrix sp. Deng01]MEB4592359.1 ionic transporter y4hA [Candidatus Thiothrix sp. Deng01]